MATKTKPIVADPFWAIWHDKATTDRRLHKRTFQGTAPFGYNPDATESYLAAVMPRHFRIKDSEGQVILDGYCEQVCKVPLEWAACVGGKTIEFQSLHENLWVEL